MLGRSPSPSPSPAPTAAAARSSATWTLNAPGGAGIADSGDFDGAQPFTGTVNFADGDTSETITILVQGDDLVEDRRDLHRHPVRADRRRHDLADGNGTGTITNDDAAGAFSIDDVTHHRGQWRHHRR